jgi:hypothetical protein
VHMWAACMPRQRRWVPARPHPQTAIDPYPSSQINPRGRTFTTTSLTTGAYKSCTTTDLLRPLCSNGGSVCGLTSQLGAQCVAGLLNQMITNACGPGTCFSGVGTVMTNGASSMTVPAMLSACCGPTARPSDANLQACVNSVNAWNQARLVLPRREFMRAFLPLHVSSRAEAGPLPWLDSRGSEQPAIPKPAGWPAGRRSCSLAPLGCPPARSPAPQDKDPSVAAKATCPAPLPGSGTAATTQASCSSYGSEFTAKAASTCALGFCVNTAKMARRLMSLAA